MKPILECSAFELADQIRTLQRSSLEVVETHIEEIEKWNPELNALVQDNFVAARHEALACDQKLKAADFDVSKLPPLFGVPYTMKEMITVNGFKHTLGSVHRREALADRDATVVERLRQAGAILLGTTNVPELGFWFECSNPIYGRTNNPYDLSRTSGGSSGGEAAIIGCGASPFGIGSDIGGSIRMPAAFCGIFGHKPSRHIVPLTGHFPLYFENASDWSGEKHPLTVLGPMSRRATDLYPLMQLLIGPDGFDSEIKTDFKIGERVTDWSSKTVWVMPSPRIRGVGLTDDEMRDSVKVAAGYFEAMGAKIKTMREDLFHDAVSMWFASLSRANEGSFTEILSHGNEINYPREFFKIALSRGDYTLPSLFSSLLESYSRKSESLEQKRVESLAKLHRLKVEINRLLGDNSILILPVHPRVAPKHYAPLLRPFDYAMTAIFNSLETPATSVPMGLDGGLPLAVQIVAGEYQDHLTLSAAETLETAFGGWQAPRALR